MPFRKKSPSGLTKRLDVRVAPGEKAEIRAIAKDAGLAVSELVRLRVLGRPVVGIATATTVPVAPAVSISSRSGSSTSYAATASAKPAAKPEKKEIERRYTLGFGVSAQNIFNHPNYAPPVGVLGSTLFGESTALASTNGNSSANRIVDVETFFRF